MEFPNALKWTMVNRLLAVGAALIGITLVAVGFGLGFWGSFELLLDDPLNPDMNAVAEQANPILTLTFVVVGFVVWQIGKTYALYRTLPRASGRAAARQFDHERVKSDVVGALDGRLTKIEEELEETRRSVHELKRAEHAAAFDIEESSAPESAADDPAPGAVDATESNAAAGEPGEVESEADADSPTSAGSGAASTASRADDAASTTSPEADDSTASSVGPEGEGEFTFGATESSSEPDAVRTSGGADAGANEAETERDRSADERTESGDDPLA